MTDLLSLVWFCCPTRCPQDNRLPHHELLCTISCALPSSSLHTKLMELGDLLPALYCMQFWCTSVRQLYLSLLPSIILKGHPPFLNGNHEWLKVNYNKVRRTFNLKNS